MSPLVARRVFDTILAGGWTPVQIGAFLVALDLLGPQSGVIGAGAKALRAKMSAVPHRLPLVFDISGTGGDDKNSVNISTGAAIIVASLGVPVAKYASRAVSSRTGSADVLLALGVPLDVPPDRALEVLEAVGITSLLAPVYHKALDYAAAPRRELGVATIFNALGPLANPAQPTHQLVGCSSDELRVQLGAALAGLGVQGAWVVHSEDGLDEISPHAPTRVSVIAGGKVEEGVVTPEDFGLGRTGSSSIEGGDAKRNASILLDVLSGKPHPARSALVLNAAASLAISKDLRLREAAELVQKALDGGQALACLERWRAASRTRAAAS